MKMRLTVHSCDICGNVFEHKDVGEYTTEKVSFMRVDGYYKPEAQAEIKDICWNCSNEILKVFTKLKNETRKI